MRINSIPNYRYTPQKQNVIRFKGSQTLINKGVKELLLNDSKQAEPLFLKVKSGFLERFLKKISDDKTSRYIVSVAGESASGKTTFVRNAQEIMANNGKPCTIISADDYFRDVSKKRKEAGSFAKLLESGYSFDTPDAINIPLLKAHLIALKNKAPVMSPKYDFTTSSSIPRSKFQNSTNLMFHEGLFALNDEFDSVTDAKVYVKTPFNVMKDRWFKRTAERNTVGEEAIKQFKDVTDKAKIYIYPQEDKADIVVNGLSDSAYQKEVINRLIDITS